jgi:protocatechuate 3,4-dioxygenase beta subunit
MSRALPLVVFCATALLAVASAGTAARGASCAPTASDGGGPDRGEPPLRAKIGTGHVLSGVVLSPSCAPVAGARVSFWQANAKGVYTNATRGAVMTDRSGRFRFEGPRPGDYGRGAHIHIKVEAAAFEPLFTEYFPPRGSARGSVRLVLTPSGV